MHLSPVIFLLVSFLFTVIATYFFRSYALNKGIIDIPNGRSSHSIPTPRGGGISIVIIYLLSLVVIGLAQANSLMMDINSAYLLSLFVGGGLVAIIGFWDDHQPLPPKYRFAVHLAAATLSLWLLPQFPQVNVFGWSFSFGILSYPFYLLVLIWLLNLYNFMDGIDGIASIEAISVLLGASLILYLTGETQWVFLLILLAVSIAGFLVFNWPPAKIFMGDACSGFLGFILGLFAIITSADGGINLWSWLILLGIFVVDATVTLIRRVKRGDTWHEAHRSHAYQILSRKWNSHKKVTLAVLCVNLFWLLPLAWASAMLPDLGIVFSVVALVPIILFSLSIGAGIPEP